MQVVFKIFLDVIKFQQLENTIKNSGWIRFYSC